MGHRYALCSVAGNDESVKTVGNAEREGKLVQIVLIVSDLVVAKGGDIETKVSPPAPPLNVSLPAPPVILLARALPVATKFAFHCNAIVVDQVVHRREPRKTEGGQRRFNRIIALACKLRDLVTGDTHYIGVITKPANHRVYANAAVKSVVARVTSQDIGKCRAGGINVAGASEREVLKARPEAVG